MTPEQVPADLIAKIYPVVLEHGIPWHDDATRIIAAAVLTEALAAVGGHQVISDHDGLTLACPDPDCRQRDDLGDAPWSVSVAGILAAVQRHVHDIPEQFGRAS